MQEAHALRLRDRIEERIATGVYAPGERLEETALADQFGVSRTPVREALQQLSAIGLIELRGRRGAIVSAPDASRLLEMFEVMAELEAMCARLAARRLLPADEALLRETLAACQAAADDGEPDSYYYQNERFHRAIYLASGNRFLAEQSNALHTRLAPFRRLQLRVRNRMRTSCAEHGAIVEAIISGDGELAAERLRNHVAVQGERFSDLMATLDRAKIGAA
jgi:DNA-binding GntR family transcriptional regulator